MFNAATSPLLEDTSASEQLITLISDITLIAFSPDRELPFRSIPIEFTARVGSIMDKSMGKQDPVFTPEPDTQLIKRLEAMLDKAHPKLVGMDGEEILLPDSVYQALRQVIHMMAAGRTISLVPHDLYLSSQEAAEILNVSRPFLYTLLDGGQIPYTMVGTHRRIRVEDLMEYKRLRDSQRRQALGELAAFSQELGFYDAANESKTDNKQ